MRKRIALILVLTLFCGLLAGCGGGATPADGAELRIVTTIFPLYDWTRVILGDNLGNVRLTLLLDNGVDMHSYQPTVNDLVTISTCDLFLYVGGESDAWVNDALAEAVNQNMLVLNLMESRDVSVKTEEAVEGMQADEEEENAYDEHIWLSLKNAKACCAAICDKLSQLMPDQAQALRQNTEAYLAVLDGLDARYADTVSAGARSTLLFADRFPFRYLLDDYGLSCYAAFPGCEAEAEASFETVAFLAEKVKELELPAVLIIDGSTVNIADTVIQTSGRENVKVLTLDSLQSVSLSHSAPGTVSYAETMEQNLAVIKEALG